jgi:hypothetical protein
MGQVQITRGNYYNPDMLAETIDPSLVEPTGSTYPTGRVLDGSSDHGYAQEWAEPGVLPDGRRCRRMFLFSEEDIEGIEEEENYPWDMEHVVRIVLE